MTTAGREGRGRQLLEKHHEDPLGNLLENPLENRSICPQHQAGTAVPVCLLSQDLSIPEDLPAQDLLLLEFSSLADLHVQERPSRDRLEQGPLGCIGRRS